MFQASFCCHLTAKLWIGYFWIKFFLFFLKKKKLILAWLPKFAFSHYLTGKQNPITHVPLNNFSTHWSISTKFKWEKALGSAYALLGFVKNWWRGRKEQLGFASSPARPAAPTPAAPGAWEQVGAARPAWSWWAGGKGGLEPGTPRYWKGVKQQGIVSL